MVKNSSFVCLTGRSVRFYEEKYLFGLINEGDIWYCVPYNQAKCEGQVLLSPGIDAHGRPWKLLGFRFFEREDTAPGERFCKRMILIYNYNYLFSSK